MELNITKLLTVYEKVELAYLSNKLEMDELVVTNKISQMILNGKIDGVLDQAKGIVLLGVQSEYTNIPLYEKGMELVEELKTTVDSIESKTYLLK